MLNLNKLKKVFFTKRKMKWSFGKLLALAGLYLLGTIYISSISFKFLYIVIVTSIFLYITYDENE